MLFFSFKVVYELQTSITNIGMSKGKCCLLKHFLSKLAKVFISINSVDEEKTLIFKVCNTLKIRYSQVFVKFNNLTTR